MSQSKIILRRRGTALIYMTAAMVVFVAIVSLAVDVGHVRVVKNSLQHAADAAARYAVFGLSTGGVTAARTNAVTAAGNNTADNTSVVVDPNNDVEFGAWDSTAHSFTVLTGSAQSTANAVCDLPSDGRPRQPGAAVVCGRHREDHSRRHRKVHRNCELKPRLRVRGAQQR